MIGETRAYKRLGGGVATFEAVQGGFTMTLTNKQGDVVDVTHVPTWEACRKWIELDCVC